MAGGAPVIAIGRGSVRKVVEHRVTGFIVNNVDKAGAVVPLITTLNRTVVRERFMQRFSAERMARDYLALYGSVLRRGAGGALLNSAAAA
jgi:glycosyltransferase involved in cell wall biosynthesis